jgi:HAD superfamily hydrolase (TIGR01509 family)
MQNSLFEAVIFDMDGVVIDTRKLIEDFWQAHATHHGITITAEVMEQSIHGCPARESINRVFTRLTAQEKKQLFEACEEFETGIQFIATAGIKAFLAQLKQYNIPVALVTSSLPPKVSKVQKALQLETAFDVIVTSDLIEKGKPNPACYLLAAKKLNKEASKCIVFEDAVSGIKAAVGAGMYAIGVGPASQATILQAVGAQTLVPDFTKVHLQKEASHIVTLQLTTTQSVLVASNFK